MTDARLQSLFDTLIGAPVTVLTEEEFDTLKVAEATQEDVLRAVRAGTVVRACLDVPWRAFSEGSSMLNRSGLCASPGAGHVGRHPPR